MIQRISQGGLGLIVICREDEILGIVTDGDVVGCIASLYQEGDKGDVNDAEAKLIQTAASFLGKQFEG